MLITKKKFIYFNFKFFEFVEFIIYFLKNKLNEKLLILKKYIIISFDNIMRYSHFSFLIIDDKIMKYVEVNEFYSQILIDK